MLILFYVHYLEQFYTVQNIISRAANEEQVKVVQCILSKSSNQPLHNIYDHRTPLIASCHKRNYEISKLLLDHSPGLTFISEIQANQTPLHIACSLGLLDIVKIILKALQSCIDLNKFEKSSVFLDCTDKEGQTPFYCACESGSFEIVKELIEFHRENSECVALNVNAYVTGSKRTPLQVAIQNENMDIVQLLLSINSINIHQKGKLSKETITKLLSLCDSTEVTLSLKSENPDSGHTVPKRRHPLVRSTTTSGDRTEVKMTANGVMPDRVRSKTVADERVMEKGKGIFEHIQSGKLIVLSKQEGQSYKYKDLEQILVAPLAEAATCSNLEIMMLLLNRGARDEKGLACRILFFMKQVNMVQNVLAHHVTSISHPSSLKSTTHSIDLELSWSKMKLPECHTEWFEQEVKLYLKKDEENSATSNLVFDNHQSQNEVDHDQSSLNVIDRHRMSALKMDSISSICLFNNQLESAPVQLFQLPNVQVLDISNNKIVELQDPSSVSWNCPGLKELKVSGNSVSTLPRSLWKLQNLCFLDCSNNNIEKLFDENIVLSGSKCAPSLENINLSKNKLIGELGAFLFELSSLKQLDLSCNKISSLPMALWKNKVLNDLSVSNNKIQSLPMCEREDEFQELFDKQRKHIAPFQPGMGDATLPSLSSNTPKKVTGDSDIKIDLVTKTPLKRKESTSFSLGVSHSYTYSSLSKLNISGNNFSFFPQGLSCLAPNLKGLDISNNKELNEIDIMYIPPKLEILMASKCGITRIGNLAFKNYRTTILRNCRYGEVSGQECNHRSHTYLSKLTKLNVSGNKLTTIPLIKFNPPDDAAEEAEQARKESAYISGNVDLIYPLLKALYLSGNCLTLSFNPNIGHMKKLKQVDLSSNIELEEIPMEFGYLLKKLNELNINNTPKLGHIEEYRDASLNHLLGYMRSCLKA